MLDHPFLVFVIILVALWVSTRIGAFLRLRHTLEEAERSDLSVILTAGLTLLGLIIGFTFSMAVNRYDQRKNGEATEANAITTEFVRAQLLSPETASHVQNLLRRYVRQRIRFYSTRSPGELQAVKAAITQTHSDLWSAVQAHYPELPPPIGALLLSGMNDVMTAEAYAQAAWWNRIPTLAWILLAAIAAFCNGLLGYASRRPAHHAGVFLLLPLIASVSFFLIADIDSPRGGIIRVYPQNLESASRSLLHP
jgi:hypothetical protein